MVGYPPRVCVCGGGFGGLCQSFHIERLPAKDGCRAGLRMDKAVSAPANGYHQGGRVRTCGGSLSAPDW